MRLLNTKTLEFAEFYDEDIPHYAILSHRWETEEVSFQAFPDYRDGKKRGKGYTKIEKLCALALERTWKWAWIDTCCIDKSSSAELSEAINSMFRWYANARECFAYLSDVPPIEGRSETWTMKDGKVLSKLVRGLDDEFKRSLWFKRGWTLQELLAPRTVHFYDQAWNFIGSRHAISEYIAAASGIAEEDVSKYHTYSVTGVSVSAATKMSWASGRKTTRIEDRAYCLLGLFDVNMPLLYGEGHKAFIRLQLEIIRKSDDESIFAWKSHPGPMGMLADHPHLFRESGNIVENISAKASYEDRLPYSMTNKGLALNLPVRVGGYSIGSILKVSLNCWMADDKTGSRPVAIVLRKEDTGWERIHCDKLFPGKEIKGDESALRIKSGRRVKTIYVGQHGL